MQHSDTATRNRSETLLNWLAGDDVLMLTTRRTPVNERNERMDLTRSAERTASLLAAVIYSSLPAVDDSGDSAVASAQQQAFLCSIAYCLHHGSLHRSSAVMIPSK